MAYLNTLGTNSWIPPEIKQLQQKGLMTIGFNVESFCFNPFVEYGESHGIILKLQAIIKKPSGKELTFDYLNSDGIVFVIDEDGEYTIRFNLDYRVTYSYGGHYSKTDYRTNRQAYFAVESDSDKDKYSPYTIKNVIDRVLSVTPTRTVNGVNKYTFRNNAEDYATEESPEFTFTGKHLFEVMLDIASYKKMFPALYKDEIYFRPFWNGEMLTSDDLPPPTKAVLCSAIDQYCTALDSYVENMVCINDTRVGTVIEPYKGGYISGRSNSGSAISETTTVIPTQSPIYQSIAVEVGETNGYTVGDIQSYVYEQEEYDSLSDSSAAYPYSKNYALKFTRFENNYTELAHRIKTSSTISAAFTKPALANIIDKATNGAVGNAGVSLLDWLSSFIKSDEEQDDAALFADLLFQPTYIPVVNARVRQYKPMFSEEDYEATLFYNQQSEVVDSEAFGEHVKGLVQKLGNHTEIRVYRFERIDDVPTVGTLIDEKSVYNVAMTIFENHVDVTLCLVDYAELSTYIGVKNEIKTSDISATKWCNRFINWEEYLVFSHQPYLGTTTLSITKQALEDIVSFMDSDAALTCAMLTSYAEGDVPITTAFAPIKHLAIGNSIYFQWEMLDNFAVGYKSEKAPENATDAWTGTLYDRAQEAVRYCDSYGRMETLDFQLLKTGPTCANSSVIMPEVSTNIQDEVCTVSLSRSVDFYLYCWVFHNHETSDAGVVTLVETHIFNPQETSFSFEIGENGSVLDISISPHLDGSIHREAYMRYIAHSYPEKRSDLLFSLTPTFELNDLLIKKDSAEALKFAAQYHFRQDWRDFIIGSGMSNFCSLVGGSCSQLQMFISKRPINRFERHIKFDSENYLELGELPAFTIDEENLRVEITLPESVNDYGDRVKSWGLVGVDRNGNRQLIFGENKNSKNENFKTTIYLVPRQKNNEPKSRATYTLYRATSNTSRGCAIYVDGVIVSGTGYEETLEITRRAKVTIENTAASSVNLSLSKIKVLIDGTREIISSEQVNIGYRGSYTFAMNSDMVFDVWTTAINPSDPMPM